MNTPYVYYIRFTTLVSDIIATNLSFIICFYFISSTYTSLGWTQNFLQALIVLNISWFVAAYMIHLYGKKIIYLEELYRRTWRSFALHFTIFLSFLFFSGIHLPAPFCISYLAVDAAILFVSRFGITYLSDNWHKKYNLGKRIAIVGFNETAEKLADYFYNKQKEYNFHGFFDDEFCKHSGQLSTALGSIEHCIAYATENHLEEIYSTILPRQNNKIERLVESAEQHCIRVKFVPDFTTHISNEFYINKVGQFPVITLRKEPLEHFRNRFKKRVFDIAVSAILIITVLSWLTPLLALLIKFSSRGPVFFTQKRSGKQNQPFNCFKFRTMRVNEASDERQATKNDDRITRIGAILRKTSLDELPQFFNVFMGTMSITGPRPHMLKHTEQYGSSIDKYMVRHFLKPGITGWAQVNGYRGETETDELMRKRVEYDLWYMENWSLMLDVRIFFMTVIQFFKHNSRAY